MAQEDEKFTQEEGRGEQPEKKSSLEEGFWDDGGQGAPMPPPPPAQGQGTTKAKKQFSGLFVILLSVVLVGMSFFAGWLTRYYTLDEGLRRFMWAKDLTDSNYYKDLDEDLLYENIMDALESQLDPYSCYYSPEEYKAIIKESEGSNTGVGISLSQDGDNIVFYHVVGNSPAYKQGIRRGMYMTAYGTAEPLTKLTDPDDFSKFLAQKDETILLACGYEADGSDAKTYTLTRAAYLASYCSYRDSGSSFVFTGDKELTLTEANDPLKELDETTAYIALDEFNGNAAAEFKLCLDKMKERGRTNLVLDLRYNGGGYMDTLCTIASYLMRDAEGKNPTVGTIEYSKSGKKAKFVADGNYFDSYFTKDSRIRVLANEGTASASECLLGAMLDYHTVDIADVYLHKGEEGVARTYGKGIMQSHFSDSSGQTMKLTVAYIKWPVSGRCIHGTGVNENDGATGIASAFLDGKDAFLTEVLK